MTAQEAPPRVAILFWFFKEPQVCRRRVEALRRLNPDTPIYGLYGGPAEDAESAAFAVGPACDDLYAYEGAESSHWKWIHGDQIIADWYARRGRNLPWDSVLVVQWDMLLTAPVSALLPDLRPGEAIFSGLRPMAEVVSWWGWGGLGGDVQRMELAAFKALLADSFAADDDALWCCLFLTAVLPRAFLQAYVDAGMPEPGFLEYKLPTLARRFGVPTREAPMLKAWWRSDPATRDAPPRDRALNTTREPIEAALIATEMSRPDGRRAFHPVFETTPWG